MPNQVMSGFKRFTRIMNADALKIRIALNIAPIANTTLSDEDHRNERKSNSKNSLENLVKFKEALQHLLFNWEEINAPKFNFTTGLDFVNVQFPPSPTTEPTTSTSKTTTPQTSSSNKTWSNYNKLMILFSIVLVFLSR